MTVTILAWFGFLVFAALVLLSRWSEMPGESAREKLEKHAERGVRTKKYRMRGYGGNPAKYTSLHPRQAKRGKRIVYIPGVGYRHVKAGSRVTVKEARPVRDNVAPAAGLQRDADAQARSSTRGRVQAPTQVKEREPYMHQRYAFDSSAALVESMLGRQLIPGGETALVTATRRWLSENGCPRAPDARGRGRYLVPDELARRFPTECWPQIKHLARR